jgi:cardiolipin synthase
VIAVTLVFCLFFIRRQTLEYHLDHTYETRAQEFFGSALALADPVPIRGNKIELLQNGDGYFPAMLEAIRDARKTINFEAYIVRSDATGEQFVDALIARARAGVEVRVLLDGIGSAWGFKNSDAKRLRDAGCKFDYYHPTASWRVDRTNRRSHRRVIVIDGRIAFTGAIGFRDEWSGNAQDKEHWRDVMVRVQGPLVGKLQAAFQEHWVKTGREALSGMDQFPPLEPAGDLTAELVTSKSFSVAPLPFTMACAFAAATQRIWITNPYCTPTDDQVALLVNAVRRGVDVRLLLPGKNDDQPLTKSAGRSAYGKLLEGGVKIFEYRPTMIHSKTLVVDSLFSIIGTSNFDPRSMEINEEIDVVVDDAKFAREMESMFENDLRQSGEYTLAEFKKRSLWERATEWLALPFRSQL